MNVFGIWSLALSDIQIVSRELCRYSCKMRERKFHRKYENLQFKNPVQVRGYWKLSLKRTNRLKSTALSSVPRIPAGEDSPSLSELFFWDYALFKVWVCFTWKISAFCLSWTTKDYSFRNIQLIFTEYYIYIFFF